MTETTTKKKKTPLTEEQKMRQRVGRALAHLVFTEQARAEHPEGDKESRKAAWKAARKAQTKMMMRVLRKLERKGYSFDVPPAKVQAAE